MSQRIVSLLPSATEIVCALGARPELVGVSHECDFPVDVTGLPVLTRAKFGKQKSSAAIDAAVRVVVREALAV
jgi:iron complex transport system substrate-binding protein